MKYPNANILILLLKREVLHIEGGQKEKQAMRKRRTLKRLSWKLNDDDDLVIWSLSYQLF